MPQPGIVTTGLLVELHAAKANGGVSQGVNSPLTTQAFDTSGNLNHGTLTNFAGTTASGYAGTGTPADPHRFVLAGDNDYISLPGLGAANGAAFTYEAWVRVPTKPETDFGLISEGHNDANSPRSNLLIERFDATRYSVKGFMTNDANVTTDFFFNALQTQSATVWHQFGLIGSGGYMTGFVDGVADTHAAVAYPAAPIGAFNIAAVGARRYNASSASWYFAGDFGPSRIYNRALTPTEYATNYAAGPAWIDPVTYAYSPLASGVVNSSRIVRSAV
jgi:hypothetical protein